MGDRYTSCQYVSDDRSRHETKIERKLEEIDINLSRTNVLMQQILDKISEEYVVNDVPLVEVAYDSNYWVTFDDLSFTVPLYSPFGLQTQTGTRIPVGDLTYSIGDIAKLMEPLNIAGYQITKNTCFDCPYSERLFATYSQYTYKPRQQFYLDNRMKGDTLSVYVKATFNTDLGWSEEMKHELKIIID